MNIRAARTALSVELLTRDPGVVAVGLGECRGERVLTVLIDGPISTPIPSRYQGFAVQVIDGGAFGDGSPEGRAMAS